MKLAIRVERGTWTNARWQRWGPMRRRFAAVSLACLFLCGCVCWPSGQWGAVQMVRGEGVWFVFFEMWGSEYHVSTPDRDAARLVEALIWTRGRSW
jgi:hypothetical protein